jgi:hypothetical protein
MHPLALYLAARDMQNDGQRAAADDRRLSRRRVGATPAGERETRSAVGRLAALVRRRIIGVAGV